MNKQIKRVSADRFLKKMLIPIQSSQMKLIRQSEVYIMEEAVTDTLIKNAAQRMQLQK